MIELTTKKRGNGEKDKLHLTRTPDSLRITPYNPEFERQMTQARAIMKSRRTVLRELAK